MRGNERRLRWTGRNVGRTGARAKWRSVWQDLGRGWDGRGDQEAGQVSVCIAEEVMAPLIRIESTGAHLRMKIVSLDLGSSLDATI